MYELRILVIGVIACSRGLVWGADPLYFEKDIRPIFREHCFDCHGATEKLEGNLDLRLVRLMKSGGDAGAAITPGKADESYLLDRLHSGEMPPGEGKVPAEQIETIAQWIAQGAKTSRPEPENIGPGLGVTLEERNFWSFQPIQRPNPPSISSFPESARVRTEVDAVIQSVPGAHFEDFGLCVLAGVPWEPKTSPFPIGAKTI